MDIPLVEPIDINKLGDGVVFETNTDDFNNDTEEENQIKFKPEDVISNIYIPDEDDEEDDDDSPFERMKRRMEDITPTKDGGIFKKILNHGTGNVVPNKSIVNIHFNLYLEYADEPFDSTRLRNRPQKARLDSGQLIFGLDFGVSTMKKNELCRLIIQPKYAYGEMGSPPRIPKNATIMCEVELLNFVETATIQDYDLMTEEEKRNVQFSQRLEIFHQEKKEAGLHYSTQNWRKAIFKYQQAVHALEDATLRNEDEEKIQQQNLLTVYLNLAVCCNKFNRYDRCITWCKKAQEIDPNSAKAYYNMGKAFQRKSEFDKAKRLLNKANDLSGRKNKDIVNQLIELDSDIKKWRIQEKQMCQQMFSKPRGQSKEEQLLYDRKEKEKETKCLACSDGFKAGCTKIMNEFKNDSKLSEMPFPSYNLTVGEIEFMLEKAEEMDLMTVETKSGQNYQVKLKKK